MWHDELRARILAEYPSLAAFHRAHGFPSKTLANWVNGICRPHGELQARLRNALGELPGSEDNVPEWATLLNNRILEKYGTAIAFCRASGLSQPSVSLWARGEYLPTAGNCRRLRAVLGDDLDLPEGVEWAERGGDIDERISTLVAEQYEHHERTGQMRHYTPAEIADGCLSEQRIGQIEQSAVAKLAQGILDAYPRLAREIGGAA